MKKQVRKNFMNFILNEHESFIYPKLMKSFDTHTIFNFCSELKQLYVMITRAITFLIFYEEHESSFLTYCCQNGLISCDNRIIAEDINDYLSKKRFEVTSPEELKQSAYKAWDKKNYSLAAFLFWKAGDNNKLCYLKYMKHIMILSTQIIQVILMCY